MERREEELIAGVDGIAHFRQHGYLVLRGLFDARELVDIRAWTDEVQHWPETPGRHMMYFQESRREAGQRILNRLENFLPYHRQFNALANGPKMKAICSRLFGEEAVLFKDKINFKLPGGDGFTPHQDAQAGWERYGSLHISVMVAIDRATRENGALRIASSHGVSRLIGGEWTPLTEQEMEGMEFEILEMEPGDAAFFDSYTPHMSDPNLTADPRRALFITYGRLSEGDQLARYYADKRASYPPDIEREPDREYVYRV
jgi:ectoine hydroxylase-related dioxygenase (phytanoyl-CoA dioxygenase family)